MRAVHVVGGGPAGVMAAFAAMREGAGVRIFEKSAFPRHKVCGEFLSPAILPLLRRAGCEAGFLQLRPAVLSAMRLHFGTRVIRHPLPEPAYGLSRYELDRLLLEHAASAGAQVVREALQRCLRLRFGRRAAERAAICTAICSHSTINDITPKLSPSSVFCCWCFRDDRNAPFRSADLDTRRPSPPPPSG